MIRKVQDGGASSMAPETIAGGSPAVEPRVTPEMVRAWNADLVSRPLSWVPWRGPGSAERIGWLAREQPPREDVSALFDAWNRAAMRGEDVIPAEAKACTFMCAGGIFSHHFPDAFYLQENIDALRGGGLTASRVDIDSTAGILVNARAIRDAVMATPGTGKDIVFIGHSKGGLDIAAAIALYPEVAARTRKLITIQSPFAGSPVAQDIADDPLQHGVTTFLLENLMAGKGEMARDLTYGARRAFLAEHPLPKDLEIVSIATVDTAWISSTGVSSRYIKDRYGAVSDGLVIPVDAILPNSRFVVLRGLDHMSTISPTHQRLLYTPASITRAAVAVAFSA